MWFIFVYIVTRVDLFNIKLDDIYGFELVFFWINHGRSVNTSVLQEYISTWLVLFYSYNFIPIISICIIISYFSGFILGGRCPYQLA